MYVALGASDIAIAALKLQTADADTGYADLAGATYAAALPADDADNGVYAFFVDLRGKKRFFDLVATAGNGSTGTFITAWAVLSRGETAPNSAAERGLAAQLFV